MVYCSNCGSQISDDAYFCSKCGSKTPKGKSAKVLYPTERLTEAFYNVGLELEKAFKLAARETDAAIQRAKENLQMKTADQRTVTCSNCGAKNISGAVFCTSCGTKAAATEDSHSGGSK